ncbi:MAG: hypothetical protein JNM21_14500 [Taibaiella sp.]|nr:hypothetical protein [Taibaiella sp.]
MDYNIDTLFYDRVGYNGGKEFISPKEEIKEISFYGLYSFRVDLINVNTEKRILQYGQKAATVTLNSFKEIDAIRKVRILSLDKDWTDVSIKENGVNEKLYGAVYKIELLKSNDANFNQPAKTNLSLLANFGLNVELKYTEFVIPYNFVIAGFHGQSGSRIDKIGLILERV